MPINSAGRPLSSIFVGDLLSHGNRPLKKDDPLVYLLGKAEKRECRLAKRSDLGTQSLGAVDNIEECPPGILIHSEILD